jgi:hypothetical protein
LEPVRDCDRGIHFDPKQLKLRPTVRLANPVIERPLGWVANGSDNSQDLASHKKTLTA